MAEQYQVSGRTAADIVTSVEAGIRLNHLAPGTTLPPVRRLAADLAVSPATVAAAYRTLRQRGIVETAGRNGTRIRHRPPVAHRASEPLPDGVLDLTTGEPDASLLPDLTLALARVDTTPRGYAHASVLPALEQLTRERLLAEGIDGDITVTGGALDGIDRVLSAHLGPGDLVGIEDPCWANLRDLIAALGQRMVPVPVDECGPTPEGIAAAIRHGAKAIVITSRAQNPTGVDITATRARELRDVLGGHRGVLVIEDDHWAELSQAALNVVADAVDNWIFLRSVSKPYGPDLRLATAVGDPATIARLKGRMRIGSGWVSTVLQELVVELMADPATADTIARASRRYRSKQRRLCGALADHGITAFGDSGLNVWVHVDDETSTVTALRDRGYAVAPGARSRIESPPAIRITISGLPEDRISALAEAVAAVPGNTSPLA